MALLGVGLAVLVWALVGPRVDGWRTDRAQEELRGQLAQAPDPSPVARAGRAAPVASAVDEGRALVEMRIPQLGAEWSWVAVEGTSSADLEKGPGHYAGTPLPGARGNVAFAAHRAGHGDPFLDFDRLGPGDHVLLRQGRAWWDYRLTTSPEIIPVSATWVLDPLPGRRLTLTTCWPRYGSSKRMFVRGVLDASGWGRQDGARGTAAALAGSGGG